MAEEKPLILRDGKVSQMGAGDIVPLANLPSGLGGGYQRYFIAVAETYTIPINTSSVITGPLDNEGILVLEGRLEILWVHF